MQSDASSFVDVKPIRVCVYVDGFNLYYGMVESRYDRFKWLNIHALAKDLVEPNQQLVAVKYFTARVSGQKDKARRQTTFLEAVQTCDVAMFYGKFQAKPIRCNACYTSWQTSEEKMTDVNIATEMLTDAFSDKFDRAVLISGDSDLVPPVRVICGPLLKKSVIAAFPPNRTCTELKSVASGFLHVSHTILARCQFPEEVTKPNGHVLCRPDEWK
jgi:uncharacterized LabA/DUF88 family protein